MKLILRKLIREIVDNELNKKSDQLFHDLNFLKDFSIKSEIDNNDFFELVLYHNIEENETIVTITKDEKGWSIDYNIIGYLRDQTADFKIGPFEGYDDFIKTATNQIKNNLTLTTLNSDDNIDHANEKFVEDMVKEMLSKKEEIMSLPKGQLEDLKRFCKLIDNALKIKTMEEIMPTLYSKNKRLTWIHNILNKVQGVGFYQSLNKNGFHNVEY